MEPWRRKLREQVGRYELTTLYSCMKLSKYKFKKLNINYYIILFPRNTKKKKKGKSILQCAKSGPWLSKEEELPRGMRA